MSHIDSKEQNANSYKCTNCGNAMYYNANIQNLQCANCKSIVNIQNIPAPQKHRLLTKDEHSAEYKDWMQSHKVCKCVNCGSSIMLNTLDMSTICPYCNTPFVLDKTALPDLIPDAIIPFTFDDKSAGQKLQNFAKRKFYVNGKLKKDFPNKKITGTYIPSFLYDADSATSYYGTLVKPETVKTKNGTSTVMVEFRVSGNINVQHRNVLVESSTILNQLDINGVLPFDHSKAYQFKDDYILGYNVEYYNESLSQTEKTAQIIYEQQIKQAILRKYPQATGIGRLHLDKQFFNQTYSLYLMPVYRFEYHFKKKNYITYMNGQTGKVNNNLPKSVPKILMTVFFGLLLILLPILLSIL